MPFKLTAEQRIVAEVEIGHAVEDENYAENLIYELIYLRSQLAACVCGPRRTDAPPKDGTVILAHWTYNSGADMSVAHWVSNINIHAWYDECNDRYITDLDPDWWAEIKEDNNETR